jgi:phage gp46-like protein
MNGLQNFEGDLLLAETIDGGDVTLENGLFVSDNQFSTAVYLSLFGGNKTDNGKVKSENEYWMNFLSGTTESEKLRSRFQYILTGLPMSVKNIREAEKAAAMDLQWFIDEKIADEVFTTGQAVGKNKFNLKVEILKEKTNIFKNEYFLLWGAGNGDTV